MQGYALHVMQLLFLAEAMQKLHRLQSYALGCIALQCNLSDARASAPPNPYPKNASCILGITLKAMPCM